MPELSFFNQPIKVLFAAVITLLCAVGVTSALADDVPPFGRFVDRTRLWEQVNGDLLHSFYNMYNLDIVPDPSDAEYPFKGWFFGWSVEGCNPGYPGCDAIFAARAPKLSGPWEVYSGEEDGRVLWDRTMTPSKWVPVVTAQGAYYNSWHNGDPSVVRMKDMYYMAYSATGHNKDGILHGQPGDADSDISCVMGATSRDGVHWTATNEPLLIEPSNIGGAPPKPSAYGHPKGNYHRPSLMYEEGVWKIWFDCIVHGKPMMTIYAENHGDFGKGEDWKILRGMENPCIIEYPNPDVVKVDDIYFAFGDPGGYGQGWAGRKTLEAVSLNGKDWALLGYMEPDPDVQANHVPEGFVWRENTKTWLYVNYGGQVPGDYRYERIRMKRREITAADLQRYRDLCKEASGPVPYEPRPE
jgi:hypothetical protein